MAGKTNTDKINDLIERIATLEERLDNLRGDVKKKNLMTTLKRRKPNSGTL